MADEMNHPVAIVTGGSSGIGAATVGRLLRAGYRVYPAARRLERMDELQRAGARPVRLDITDDDSIVALVETVQKECGRIDVLVNNAGYGSYGAVEDVPLEEARRQFEVNLFGLARLTQLVLPHMREQRAGTIVNITSIGGKIYLPLGAWYHATKHALEGWSDSLRVETAGFGIKVVIVEPGAIKTEWSGIADQSAQTYSGSTAYGEITKKYSAVIQQSYERGRASDPDVVAATILKALGAKRPKPRYATGNRARQLLFLRHILSDRAFDAVIKLSYRL